MSSTHNPHRIPRPGMLPAAARVDPDRPLRVVTDDDTSTREAIRVLAALPLDEPTGRHP